MKVKEYKNKIVLAELNPKASYIMLVNVNFVPIEEIFRLQMPMGAPHINILAVADVDKAVKFVEIPRKKK